MLSIERPSNSQFAALNAAACFAKAINSVVHTGVKSAGWEKSTSQRPRVIRERAIAERRLGDEIRRRRIDARHDRSKAAPGGSRVMATAATSAATSAAGAAETAGLAGVVCEQLIGPFPFGWRGDHRLSSGTFRNRFPALSGAGNCPAFMFTCSDGMMRRGMSRLASRALRMATNASSLMPSRA